MKIYVVVYQDAHKPRRGEVLGAFDNKIQAVDNLLDFLTGHNPRDCRCNLCDLCEEYSNYRIELLETGTVAEEYSIHEVEYNKNF